jgi:hypothetical protein
LIARGYAERVGLDFDYNDPLAAISRLAWLAQIPKEFDFPSSHWPPQLHHSGPFHDGSGRKDPNFPWNRYRVPTDRTGKAANMIKRMAAAADHEGIRHRS